MEQKPDSCPLEKAILTAALSHSGQRDKAGQPYILHALSVMFRVRNAGEDETVQIAAVLHDTVEDTSLTLQQIESEFGETVSHAIDALTRRDGEVYREYIRRLAENQIARIVKLADLHDNLDPRRPAWVQNDVTAGLRSRYETALAMLSNRTK